LLFTLAVAVKQFDALVSIQGNRIMKTVLFSCYLLLLLL
jgi:hypothetical protein